MSLERGVKQKILLGVTLKTKSCLDPLNEKTIFLQKRKAMHPEPRPQKGDSQYCCALHIPLLICSYVTNMTMFQEPSRRKEGTNLRGRGTGRMRGTSEARRASSLPIGARLPFVEGCGPFLPQHGEAAADGAAVPARRGIHEPRFDHVHGRRHHGRAEARSEGGGEVARKVVWVREEKVRWWCWWGGASTCQLRFPMSAAPLTCHQVVLEDQLFDQVVGHQLGAVYNSIAGDVGKATWTKRKRYSTVQ